MAGKATDRKSKGKDRAEGTEPAPLTAFSLPESLRCSEVEFPILIKRNVKVKWSDILEESEQKHKELEEYALSKMEPPIKSPFLKTECDYIKNEIFVHLIPALEETLNKAKIWDAFDRPKCFFNGLDHIVQVLWNRNPRHPERHHNELHIFNMPWVRKYLAEHPRPYYPKSWLWPQEHAATLIQKTVRQYFVQRDEEVQEMREFWRKLEVERENPELDTNPLLAKRFAVEHTIKKV